MNLHDQPPSEDEDVIDVHGLRRTFHLAGRATVTALDDVSVAVRRGTCLAVVGESGSGKSTLARVIVGLETADSGSVVLAGEPVRPTRSRSSLRRRARVVQMVFQDPQGSLNRRRPVGSAVDEVLRAHGTLSSAERRRRTEELFTEVGLTADHVRALPAELSGGQKQRVAIARALAADPDVLVLDEAVSALDVSVQAQVLALLQRLRTEKSLTYLFITHDLSVVREVADDVIVMRHGRILERGPVDEVLDHPKDPYTRLLLECAPRPGWTPRRGVLDELASHA